MSSRQFLVMVIMTTVASVVTSTWGQAVQQAASPSQLAAGLPEDPLASVPDITSQTPPSPFIKNDSAPATGPAVTMSMTRYAQDPPAPTSQPSAATPPSPPVPMQAVAQDRELISLMEKVDKRMEESDNNAKAIAETLKGMQQEIVGVHSEVGKVIQVTNTIAGGLADLQGRVDAIEANQRKANERLDALEKRPSNPPPVQNLAATPVPSQPSAGPSLQPVVNCSPQVYNFAATTTTTGFVYPQSQPVSYVAPQYCPQPVYPQPYTQPQYPSYSPCIPPSCPPQPVCYPAPQPTSYCAPSYDGGGGGGLNFLNGVLNLRIGGHDGGGRRSAPPRYCGPVGGGRRR